ncbi:MAG: KpsF/GutQ family sugar-phosphate isomerase [Desulfovibrio sp.]|jgi:arabinose-5-phosphate isomerase|nr:KpsF/GutQ family sugar-phosphate isomerase [Desulfovibrio sp.]
MCESWVERGKEVISIEIEALDQARSRLGPSFASAVKMLAACRGRIAVCGMGKSGLVGRKIAATLSSVGRPAYFLHPAEGAHGDLGAVREGDVVIALSYSGATEELLTLLPALRGLGASIIAVTSGLHSPLAEAADLVIDASVPREACPLNLAPTSSTTAALVIGDALAVCLMDAGHFTSVDFRRLHPGGALGRRLSLSVADLMHREKLPLARAYAPLGEALRILDKGGFGAVLLTDEENRLRGILTDGDLRRFLCRGAIDLARPASEFMTAGPRHAAETMSAAELMDIMEQTSITALPVLDGAMRVKGLVHMHDLLGKGRIRFAAASRGNETQVRDREGA